ncbi:MAG: hypothetical protein ACI88A_001974 [Paraglaciecola sp.]|jgi:hypothetical protein
MKDWIPFLQSLVWPTFIAILIYIFRNRFEGILESVKKRIEEGSSVGVGPSGFSLGSAPQLPDNPTPEEMIDDGEDQKTTPELIKKEKALEEELSKNPVERLQLIHTSRYLKIKNGRDYYRIVVSLDPYNTDALSKVEKVVYFLHKTFRNPVREVTNRDTNFELITAAWGEFSIRAEVYLQGKTEPLRLSRYLDIQVIK